jgi:two-component system sensor histidine kinase UhpB
MKKYLSFLIVIFLYPMTSLSQYIINIDSLFAVLKNQKSDTAKVNTLNAIASEFRNNDPDTSIYFGNKALKLAKSINYKMGIANVYLQLNIPTMNIGDYELALKYCNKALQLYDELLITEKSTDRPRILTQKGRAFNSMGIIYWYQGNLTEALKYHFLALRVREGIKDEKGISYSLNNIGLVYWNLGNYPEALKNYFAALKNFEEIGEKERIASSYVNIGLIYRDQSNYQKALNNYFIALRIFKDLGDKRNIAGSFNNIGAVYDEQGKSDEALKNYLVALKIQLEIGDKHSIANSYENIGLIYMYKGIYQDALMYLFKSLKIKEEIGNNQGIAVTYNNIGNVYRLQKNYSEASQYLQKGLLIAKENGNIQDIKYNFLSLSTLDSAQGNFEQSLKHYKIYITYRDSLNNEENTRKLVQQQLQFDFSKKEALIKVEQEKKDVVNQQQLQKQKIIRNSFIAGSILLILLLIVIINRNKLKRTVEMERMRSRLSRDLHDDIGSTLSSINILSHTAQTHLDPTSDQKTRLTLEKINERCRRLLDTMGDIIWNINPGNDTMEEVLSRMRDYSATLLEAKNIDYSINFPKETVGCQLSMDVKNNMYLIFKEAMNNLSKYSDCTKVFLSLTFDDKNIHLKIEDNGKGFDKDEIKRLGGLRNMQHRAEEIKGLIKINTAIDEGTKIELIMPRYC